MIKWPDGKQFAFTIIDDTDGATVANVKPVYDYLFKSGLITTKTVWAYPPRDKYGGSSLAELEYEEFIKELIDKGYEIASHGPGSGSFKRDEVLSGFEKIRTLTGNYPNIHINHALNMDNIYWGSKRFSFPINVLYKHVRKVLGRKSVESLGDEVGSSHFWGDFSKKNIKYTRNRVFSDLNTLHCDKMMPYRDLSKDIHSNFWFSSSDGFDCKTFTKLLAYEDIDRLEKTGGCAVVYTHFAFGFVDELGKLNEDFSRQIDYLVSKNGWFVPASELLNHLASGQDDRYLPSTQGIALDLKWFMDRIGRKLFLNV